jgi:hypothetical protein
MSDDADPISVEAAPKAFGAAKCQSLQATRLPLQLPRSPFHSRERTNAFTLTKQRGPESVRGFTLAELLVSVSVLVLLVFLAAQLLTSAATITILGHKRMDADSEARQLLDRMAFDFAQMVKRSDVDYYVKSSAGQQRLQNDQIAFYSTVPGYYPSSGAQSPLSLVAYRVNSNLNFPAYNKLERLGKGLVWNGVSTTDTPAVFLPGLISITWPYATNQNSDPAYEVIGPQVFRFEYCYLLTSEVLSEVPCFGSGCTLNGWAQVAAIVVDIAVIDPKSKVLVSDAQLARLNGADSQSQGPVLIDWGNTSCAGCPTLTQWQQTPGLLSAQWRAALDANSIGLPAPVISGIRVYERYFYLTH